MCSKPKAYRSARSRGAWAFLATRWRGTCRPRKCRATPRPTKLGAFEAYIIERMSAAAPEIIAAPALLRELRAHGYDGQLRSLQAFMNAHKSVPKPDPVLRFETESGRQMQCDFVVFRRGTDPLYAFTATFGFSRWRWARFTTDERAETLVACHHALFEALGGVPREILYDNAKTIVVARDAYGDGQHRWHAGLLDLAKRYGFLPRLCRPYRAQTKGSIERFHRYLRGNFYVPLASHVSCAVLSKPERLLEPSSYRQGWEWKNVSESFVGI
ncbi:putative integrase [Burkholderia lata]|nr:putative integrase [Burkholderia lata]